MKNRFVAATSPLYHPVLRLPRRLVRAYSAHDGLLLAEKGEALLLRGRGGAGHLAAAGEAGAEEESAAGLVSFLANAGLANVLFVGAGAASFLAAKEPKEKPFLAGGSGAASFLPKENRPPAFLAPPLALLASIVAFFAAIFLLYSSAGMLGPKPPSAETLVETEALAALAAPTGRAAIAEVKERADMVMGSVRFVVVP